MIKQSQLEDNRQTLTSTVNCKFLHVFNYSKRIDETPSRDIGVARHIIICQIIQSDLDIDIC